MNTAPCLRHASTSPPLGRWLLASTAVHLLLFVGWHAIPELHGQRDTVLSVTLTQGKAVPAPSQRLTETASSNRPPTPAPHAFRRIPDTTALEQKPAPTLEVGRTSSGQGQSEDEAAARVRARLLSDLSRHFEYPLLARLRGWEGTVLIGLDVEADGLLAQIHLARSSGYDVLDQSAIEAVRRVGRLQDTLPGSGRQRQQLRLPIVYRLTER